MSEHQHPDDGDELTADDLDELQNAIASANASTAQAVSQIAGNASTGHYAMGARNAHRELVEAYQDVTWALDRTEVHLDRADYGADTPRCIKREHAERLKETYDHPLVSIALMLGEWNRRKWLHGKPETIGAEEVGRHGLTGTQRDLLNRLQDWSDAAGAIEDTIPVLRGEAEELRTRDADVDDVAEQLEHRADRLEEMLADVDGGAGD